ncbi:LiaI-LiaF-like domain-containing protein [Halalkalibacter kiskunsagensis]|uniref:LiaI-LiaF-like domain-containing protein n=1 Tax=Halalkalibacter kiskunsagensis TaxID=1548599 RepID=A0ABV6K807_9BACI
MKTQRIFPGVLLIGVGCYYLLQQLSIPFAQQLLSWPSILFVIGFAFLVQGYVGPEYSMIFPGALLTGLAIHFHLSSFFNWWPEHWGMYTSIVGISFILSARKTKKEGYLLGSFLIIFSALSFASINPFSWLYDAYSFLSSLWPVFLIGLGTFLIFKRK